jgi:hypothetical protein
VKFGLEFTLKNRVYFGKIPAKIPAKNKIPAGTGTGTGTGTKSPNPGRALKTEQWTNIVLQSDLVTTHLYTTQTSVICGFFSESSHPQLGISYVISLVYTVLVLEIYFRGRISYLTKTEWWNHWQLSNLYWVSVNIMWSRWVPSLPYNTNHGVAIWIKNSMT